MRELPGSAAPLNRLKAPDHARSFSYFRSLLAFLLRSYVHTDRFSQLRSILYSSVRSPLARSPERCSFIRLAAFLLSAAVGIAIGLACAVLVFPQSMAYIYSKSLIETLRTLKTLVDLQPDMLSTDLHDDKAWLAFIPRLDGLRQKVLSNAQDLDSNESMLELECELSSSRPS